MGTPLALPAAARPVDQGAQPRSPLLWTLVLAGAFAAGASTVLVLESDHVSEPRPRAVLTVWVIVSYIVAGTLAWWRRPDSRFGPLLVAAGFAFFLSTLSTANGDVPYTVGIAFDL